MSDQTPAQRMAEIEQSLEDCAANRSPFGPGRDDFRFVIDRCRKLEAVVSAAQEEIAALTDRCRKREQDLDDARLSLQNEMHAHDATRARAGELL